MNNSDTLLQRVAVIADLLGKVPAGFGRTALMKCLFFLQILRGVPLRYHFRLYTYGPFDPNVLSDLSIAERLGAVRSELEGFEGGYRYELGPGADAQRLIERASDFLGSYEAHIEWVARTFGGRTARELENASTIVFVDRAAEQRGTLLPLDELVRRVHDVKPHLPPDLIESEARALTEQGLISRRP
jgi:hypothetical protein